MHRIAALWVVASVACSPGATESRETANRAPEAAVIATICASACSGPFAKIEIWRDADGAVGRYVYDGDLEACSHPPRIYFDAEGVETLAIANEPVEVGSAEAAELERKRAAQTRGLSKAETRACR